MISSLIILGFIMIYSSVAISSEYLGMMYDAWIICWVCYGLDYSLIDDIGVSVITVIFLGINFVIKLVRCIEPGFLQCNQICLYGKALMRCYCHASRRCLQRGKVMGARFPDQVGGHKPCVPDVVLVPGLSPCGMFMFWPRWWSLCLW